MAFPTSRIAGSVVAVELALEASEKNGANAAGAGFRSTVGLFSDTGKASRAGERVSRVGVGLKGGGNRQSGRVWRGSDRSAIESVTAGEFLLGEKDVWKGGSGGEKADMQAYMYGVWYWPVRVQELETRAVGGRDRLLKGRMRLLGSNAATSNWVPGGATGNGVSVASEGADHTDDTTSDAR